MAVSKFNDAPFSISACAVTHLRACRERFSQVNGSGRLAKQHGFANMCHHRSVRLIDKAYAQLTLIHWICEVDMWKM